MDVDDMPPREPDIACVPANTVGAELEAVESDQRPAASGVAPEAEAAQDHAIVEELGTELPAGAPAGRDGGFASAHGVPPPKGGEGDQHKR